MWAEKRIFDLGKILTGSTPSTGNPLFWGEEIPFISPSDFADESSQVFDTERFLSSKGAAIAPTFPKGTVLTTCIGSIGKMAISCVEIASCNQQINALICNEDNDPRFVFYCIKNNIRKLNAISGATTIPIVNKNAFGNIKIKIPDKNIQTIIANILDTLDTQIRQTETIITKLQQVKQGLLHDLLTRGIDASGQLRPPREEVPGLYKDSPLGWIPMEWETKSIREIVESFVGGAAIKTFEFSESGIGVIAKSDVTNSKYIDIAKREQFVSEKIARAYKSSIVTSEAVIVSLRDLVPSGPTVGMGSIFSSNVEYLLAQGTYGFYLKQDLLLPLLFAEYTRQNFFRFSVKKLTVGSTQVHVRSSEYLGLNVPVPPMNEQNEILRKINEIDKRDNLEIQKLEKLKKQKIGLMDDLLTGRVWVTDLIEQQSAS